MRTSLATLVCLVLTASGCGPDAPAPGPAGAPVPATGAASSVPRRDSSASMYAADDNGGAGRGGAADSKGYSWVDPRGTSIVGFGILRLVPPPGGDATFRIRYREVPDGYAATGNLQLFVLPGDAFAGKDRAYAHEFLAFARTDDDAKTDDDGALKLEATVSSTKETTVLVCYGPWTAPDAGRPAGDVPTFSIDVSSDAGSHEWVESEAGEMITTNWTNRPEVERGRPLSVDDGKRRIFIEVRPMILYDARLVRAADEDAASPDAGAAAALRAEADRLAKDGHPELATDRRERAEDLEARIARADHRLVLTPSLAEKFRRVPIRWR